MRIRFEATYIYIHLHIIYSIRTSCLLLPQIESCSQFSPAPFWAVLQQPHSPIRRCVYSPMRWDSDPPHHMYTISESFNLHARLLQLLRHVFCCHQVVYMCVCVCVCVCIYIYIYIYMYIHAFDIFYMSLSALSCKHMHIHTHTRRWCKKKPNNWRVICTCCINTRENLLKIRRETGRKPQQKEYAPNMRRKGSWSR